MPQPFELSVDGQAVDARRLECHFQSEPYPGGCRYLLNIGDVETIAYCRKEFGEGMHEHIADDKSRTLLSFVGGIKQIRIGRVNPPQFWANTVDSLNVSESKVVLKGICSIHADG
jgi:hypothetical protein